MNKISNSTHIFIYIMDINRYIDTYKNKNLVGGKCCSLGELYKLSKNPGLLPAALVVPCSTKCAGLYGPHSSDFGPAKIPVDSPAILAGMTQASLEN